MRLPSAIVLGTLAVLAITTNGCSLSQMIKMAKDQQVTFSPNPLELHGDSVKFEISGVMPVKMLKPNKAYALMPTYRYKDQKQELGDMTFFAKSYPDAATQNPKLKKNFSFYYKGGDQDRGELWMKGTASNLNGRTKSTPDIQTGVLGIILTSRLVQDVYVPVYADHGYNNQPEFDNKQVMFFFEQGSDKLQVKEIGSGRGTALDNFIASKVAYKTVVITGSHSPEGREVRNVALSEMRAKAIESWYRTRLRKYDYKNRVDSIEFVTRSVVQDWRIFKDTLSRYPNLTAEEKKQVVDIVDATNGAFLDKEANLQALPFYDKLFNEVYPKLRQAQAEVILPKEKKSDATIALLAKGMTQGTTPKEALNENEILYSATLGMTLMEREKIYIEATRKYDSWLAHNNLSAIYIEMGRGTTGKERIAYAEKAVNHANISLKRQSTPQAYTNLSTAKLMAGDAKGAQEAYASAATMKPNDATQRVLNAITGSVLIRQGNYGQAVKALSSSVNFPSITFNRGLAQLLSRNFAEASAAFAETNTIDAKYALAYYGSAIVAARKNDERAVYSNLSKAVQNDGNLGVRAVGDLEFRNFWQKDGFQKVIR